MADAIYTGWPGTGSRVTGFPITPTANNTTFSASGVGLAAAFQPYSTDAITHIGFRYGARTGTPPTYLVSLQGLNTTGLVDGSIVGGGTPASSTFTPPADATWDGLWKWEALDNSYTPTRGQVLAACIEYSSGTVDVSNCSSFTSSWSTLSLNSFRMPYLLAKSGGTWSKSGSTPPCIGWRTASGRYGFVGQGLYSTATATINHRSAAHFTIPSGLGSTFKVLGFRGSVTISTGSTVTFGIWNAAGTLLQSFAADSDHFSGNSGNYEVTCTDATLPTLDFGTKYYVGLERTGSVNVGVRGFQLAEADDRIAWPGRTNVGIGTWDGASWTDVDTVAPWIDLIIDDWTEPSAGGSALGYALTIQPGITQLISY